MGRRSFTEEFKLSAVKLVLEQSYTIAEASKSLGVDPSSLRSWLKQFSPEAGGNGTSGQSAMQAELRRLREENKRLLMEREILKKATAFFAKHPS
jgi:transposase